MIMMPILQMKKKGYERKPLTYNLKNVKENLCLIIFGLFPESSAPISLFSGPILAIAMMMMTIIMMMTMAMLMMTMLMMMMTVTNLPIVSPKWFPNGTD